jgi:hypothetical protein
MYSDEITLIAPAQTPLCSQFPLSCQFGSYHQVLLVHSFISIAHSPLKKTPKLLPPQRTSHPRRPLQTLPSCNLQSHPHLIVLLILYSATNREKWLSCLLGRTSLLYQLCAAAEVVRRGGRHSAVGGHCPRWGCGNGDGAGVVGGRWGMGWSGGYSLLGSGGF